MRGLNYQQIWDSFWFALRYLPQTILLIVVPFVLCFALGLLIAIVRIWNVPVLSPILQLFVTAMKGIPTYLFLIMSNLIYYLYFDKIAIALDLSIRCSDVNIIYFALAVFTLIFTPGMSEIMRGALLAVPAGQYEAAATAGLTRVQTMRRVIVPQMLPTVIPSLTSMIIGILKASALAYCLGVTDILNAAVRSATIAYDLLEGYIAAAIIYWALSILIEKGMSLVDRHVGKFRKQLST